MSFFESLLALVAAAVLLLQVSRRLTVPYPTMLAGAGVCLALVPGAPRISIEPHTALALFLAPALVDAAFDFPVADIRKLWRPLFALAVVAVALSAGAVAWLGVAFAIHYTPCPPQELLQRLKERNAALPPGAFVISEGALKGWMERFEAPDADELSA